MASSYKLRVQRVTILPDSSLPGEVVMGTLPADVSPIATDEHASTSTHPALAHPKTESAKEAAAESVRQWKLALTLSFLHWIQHPSHTLSHLLQQARTVGDTQNGVGSSSAAAYIWPFNPTSIATAHSIVADIRETERQATSLATASLQARFMLRQEDLRRAGEVGLQTSVQQLVDFCNHSRAIDYPTLYPMKCQLRPVIVVREDATTHLRLFDARFRLSISRALSNVALVSKLTFLRLSEPVALVRPVLSAFAWSQSRLCESVPVPAAIEKIQWVAPEENCIQGHQCVETGLQLLTGQHICCLMREFAQCNRIDLRTMQTAVDLKKAAAHNDISLKQASFNFARVALQEQLASRSKQALKAEADNSAILYTLCLLEHRNRVYVLAYEDSTWYAFTAFDENCPAMNHASPLESNVCSDPLPEEIMSDENATCDTRPDVRAPMSRFLFSTHSVDVMEKWLNRALDYPSKASAIPTLWLMQPHSATMQH
jgi:hypothetical protein